MKLEASRTLVNVEGTQQFGEKEMSIRLSNLAFASDAFTQYSNPISAIVREITSNCFDSHMEAKMISALTDTELIENKEFEPEEIPYLRETFANWEDRPIRVSMNKSDEDSIFDSGIIFEDFGIGLSPSRMEKVFSEFFSSTKRDSNVEIGAFGVGAKSPLGYTDMFSVRTVWNKVEYNYVVRRGNPMPVVVLLNSYPVEQENGTRVEVRIKDDKDHDRFAIAVRQQLAYFDNIEFINCGTYYPIWAGEHFIFKEFEFTNLHISLGGVYYPIDQTILSRESGTTLKYDCPIGLKFDIGDLDVVWNRESINYTSKTIEALKEKLELAKLEFQKLWSDQFDDIDSFEKFYLAAASAKVGRLNIGKVSIPNVHQLIRIEPRYPKFNKLDNLPDNPWKYFFEITRKIEDGRYTRYDLQGKIVRRTPPNINPILLRHIYDLSQNAGEAEDILSSGGEYEDRSNSRLTPLLLTAEHPAYTKKKKDYWTEKKTKAVIIRDKYEAMYKPPKPIKVLIGEYAEDHDNYDEEEGETQSGIKRKANKRKIFKHGKENVDWIWETPDWSPTDFIVSYDDWGLTALYEFDASKIIQIKLFLQEAYDFALKHLENFDDIDPEWEKEYDKSHRKEKEKFGRLYKRQSDEIAVKNPIFNLRTQNVEWKLGAWKSDEIEDYTGMIIYGYDTDVDLLNMAVSVFARNEIFAEASYNNDNPGRKRKNEEADKHLTSPFNQNRIRIIRIGMTNSHYFKKSQSSKNRIYIGSLFNKKTVYLGRWVTAMRMIELYPEMSRLQHITGSQLAEVFPEMNEKISFLLKYVTTYTGYRVSYGDTISYGAGQGLATNQELKVAITELIKESKLLDMDAIKIFNEVRAFTREYPIIATVINKGSNNDIRAYLKGMGNIHPKLLVTFAKRLKDKRRESMVIEK